MIRGVYIFIFLLITAIAATTPFDRIPLDFTLENSSTTRKYLPETMGGGIALLDYNNDGRLDIFFVNGAKLQDPMPHGARPDKADPRYWNRLYRQNSDGTFTEVAEQAGVTGMPQNRYGMGAAVGDMDNDGDSDLYVTGVGGNTLYRNNGNGTFTDISGRARVQGEGWSASAGFFDYNNDGHLDLFVCRYLTWSFEDKYCGDKKPGGRSYCHPDNFPGVTNLLYRNNGDGTFTDVSQAAGIANPEGKGLGVAFADFDGDGWIDIYVANDSVQSFLYRNNGKGGFTDVSLEAGAGFNEDGKTFAGMGVDFADYNNDGRPDIIVTDLSNERYVLFRNAGNRTFSDETNSSQLGRESMPFSGWSTRLIDYDNDGWKDLFVAQGHVMDNIDQTTPPLKYLQPPLLLRNLNGKFVRANSGPAFEAAWAGRGAAVGDIDNDGDLDIVVSNIGQRAYLLRNNTGNRNNWAGLQLTGRRSNRDAIGAQVRVGNQLYTVNTAAGYLSSGDKRIIVGLGASDAAVQAEIRWPSGVSQKLQGLTPLRIHQVAEPE